MALKLQWNAIPGLRSQASAVSRRSCCPVQVVQVGRRNICCRSAPGDSQPATAASSSGDEIAALKKQLAKMEEEISKWKKYNEEESKRQKESDDRYKQAVIIFLLILALYLLLMAGYAYSIRVMALGATGRL